jgi:peroxiredoxin
MPRGDIYRQLLDLAESVPPRPSKGQTKSKNPMLRLNSQLSAYSSDSRNRRPEMSAAYDALVDRLDALDRGEIGPKLGAQMPDFALPDERGRLANLSALLQTGPVVVSFNRGHWCPYCRMDLRSLAAHHDRIEELGASVVSIMPDSAQFTADYAQANELPFPVLSDMDLGYSLSLGLIFWVGAEVQRLYRDVGVDLERYHGNDGYFLPMAAKFVVGQDGLVKARRVNIEFRERMEPDEIVAVLERVRGGDA